MRWPIATHIHRRIDFLQAHLRPFCRGPLLIVGGVFTALTFGQIATDVAADGSRMMMAPRTVDGSKSSIAATGAYANRQESERVPRASRNRSFLASNDAPKLYANRPLAHWLQRIKDLSPQAEDIETAVTGLTEIVEDSTVPWYTRRQAANTLGRLGEPAESAVPVLIRLVREGDESEESPRVWAAKALALFGKAAAPATPLAREIVRTQEAPAIHRLVMVELLGRIGVHHPQAIPTLVELLEMSPNKPGSTIQTGSANHPATTKRHQRISEELGELATEALAGIGPDAATATPALMRLLLHPHASTRRKSAEALTAFGSAAEIAAPLLFETMAFDSVPAVRDAAEAALAAIGPNLKMQVAVLTDDSDPELRTRAIRILAQYSIRQSTVLPELQTALKDQAASVRFAAAAGAWRTTNQPDPALRVVAELLAVPQRELRMEAVQLLVEMGQQHPLAVRTCLAALTDARQPRHVRQAAAQALRKIRLAREAVKNR